MLIRTLLYLMLMGVVILPASAELPKDIPRDAIAKHKIKKGENLYIIAKKYKVDIRNIIRANKLKPPYTIRIGSSLQIPGSPYHIVKRGQSLSSIAKKYKVGIRSLVVLNKLKKPYVIRPKQKIYIPEPSAITPKKVATKTPEKISGAKISLQIAPSPPSPPPAKKTKKIIVSLERAPLPPFARSVLPTRKVSLSYAPPPPSQKPASATAVATIIDDDFTDNGASFLPPVVGKIISKFGNQGRGVYNDGINFATKRGQMVRSSRDGIVAYSNNKLRRLGNLIIVRHTGGYMTIYAHNDRNIVQEGDRVQRGQVIAISGNSGGVTSPQLHFQIRKNDVAVNPIKYIGG